MEGGSGCGLALQPGPQIRSPDCRNSRILIFRRKNSGEMAEGLGNGIELLDHCAANRLTAHQRQLMLERFQLSRDAPIKAAIALPHRLAVGGRIAARNRSSANRRDPVASAPASHRNHPLKAHTAPALVRPDHRGAHLQLQATQDEAGADRRQGSPFDQRAMLGKIPDPHRGGQTICFDCGGEQ